MGQLVITSLLIFTGLIVLFMFISIDNSINDITAEAILEKEGINFDYLDENENVTETVKGIEKQSKTS